MFTSSKKDSLATTYNYTTTTDYAEVLDKFNLRYKVSEYYWQVGKMPFPQGWVLYLSIVKFQVLELLQIVLPIFIDEGVSFKLIRSYQLASWALDGNLGSEYLAKIICIYPANDQQAISLAKKLVPSTENFRGPFIRGTQRLGGVVYANLADTSKTLYPEWPFGEITPAYTAKAPTLLNYKYYPIVTIKKDAKGDVSKAIYFKTFWQIKSCIIKQGRINMFCDESGRDIKDRLLWQAELSKYLAADLPLPRIIDSFEQNGAYYLAMEPILGISFTHIFAEIGKDSSWIGIRQVHQLKLLNYLLEVVSIVDRLHKKGFIHRDITPENFLVDKQDNIWLIDLELMWSSYHRKPNPPFGLGTPGFISPEQSKGQIPTKKEDIYALGAFMMHVFTGMYPTKLLTSSSDELRDNLSFLTRNKTIANLVTSCLENDPLQRPDLDTITKTLKVYKEQLQAPVSSKPASTIKYTTDPELVTNTIQAALDGLSNPAILRPDSTWLSSAATDEDQFGNEHLGTATYNGWFKGVAGVLWFVAIAKKFGLNVETCMPSYTQGWDYLDRHYFNASQTDIGLYSGGAGIALAVAVGLESGLLYSDNKEILFDKCLSQQASNLSLAEGVAGQGTALLNVSRLMSGEFVDERLSKFIQVILGKQRKNGSWDLDVPVSKNCNAALTLGEGVPGIVWFLLNYLQFNSNSEVNKSVTRALNWLIKAANHKKANNYIWPVIYNSRSSTIWSTDRGLPGITLVLIKAYEVLGDDIYRQVAEANLRSIPAQPVIMNFTLGNGLAGIGEVYLEAERAFKNIEWHNRAEWIAQFFLHTFQNTSDQDGHWLPESNTTYTADLFTGCSGIIHFLMHYIDPYGLRHPLHS